KKGGTGYGSIFQLTPSGQFTTLYSFSPPFVGPAGLRKGVDGALYGVTGSTAPTFAIQPTSIFQFTTNGAFTTLYGATNAAPGFNSSPVQGPDGMLYGTTVLGGISNSGTIFRIDTSGNLEKLADFTDAYNNGPNAPLIEASDGNFYGTTAGGPPFSSAPGSIFRLVSPPLITALDLS